MAKPVTIVLFMLAALSMAIRVNELEVLAAVEELANDEADVNKAGSADVKKATEMKSNEGTDKEDAGAEGLEQGDTAESKPPVASAAKWRPHLTLGIYPSWFRYLTGNQDIYGFPEGKGLCITVAKDSLMIDGTQQLYAVVQLDVKRNQDRMPSGFAALPFDVTLRHLQKLSKTPELDGVNMVDVHRGSGRLIRLQKEVERSFDHFTKGLIESSQGYFLIPYVKGQFDKTNWESTKNMFEYILVFPDFDSTDKILLYAHNDVMMKQEISVGEIHEFRRA